MSAPLVLVADDDAAIRTVIARALGREGYEVRAAGAAAPLWRWIEQGQGDVVVLDVGLPDASGLDLLPQIKKKRADLPIVVMSAQNTILTAVAANQRGAFDYLAKPFDLTELVSVARRALEQRARPSQPEGSVFEDGPPIVGRAPAMQEVYRMIGRLASADLSVLITGPTGSGKELIARALHDFGPRRAGPFVAVNVAAIPKDLIESELFGHEKGAFTGAVVRRSGRFEQAAGGTLFLDEIGDMPLDAQTRLLRVLQQGEFTTVGGVAPIKADARILAASHRDLEAMVRIGAFREDLYYRLAVAPIRAPALAERREDVPALCEHFLARSATPGQERKSLSPEALRLLEAQEWPGNVRELENFVRRLVALYPDERLGERVVRAELERRTQKSAADPGGADGLAAAVERFAASLLREEGDGLRDLHQRLMREVEPPMIARVLGRTGGNQVKAAEILGLNRNTLRKKIREFGVDVARAAAGDAS